MRFHPKLIASVQDNGRCHRLDARARTDVCLDDAASLLGNQSVAAVGICLDIPERNQPLVLIDDGAEPIALSFGLSCTRRRSDVFVRKRAIAVRDGSGGAEIGFSLAQLR